MTPIIIETRKNYEAAIIIHHIDADGYCGAYWATKYAEKHGVTSNKIFYRKHDYANTVDVKTFANKDNILVIMVDISFPREQMEELYNKVKSHSGSDFIWVDHHATAINAMADMDMPGIRYSGIAASELMYWFYKGYTQEDIEKYTINDRSHVEMPSDDCPLGTWLVADNDVWAHTIRDTRYFAQYVNTVIKNNFKDTPMSVYDEVFGNEEVIIDGFVAKGEAIYNELAEKEWKPIINNGGVKHITLPNDVTLSVYQVETLKYNRFMFESVEDEVDLYVKYSTRVDDGRHKYTLYTGNSELAKSINIGELCKSIAPNGGGHFGAGGFTSDKEVFI